MKKKEKEKEIIISSTVPLDSGFTHVLFNLASQGYSHIRAEYSGGGDDGAIDNIVLIERGGILEVRDGFVEESSDLTTNEIESNLKEVIEHKIYDYILKDASDWVNNDGGGGTVYISTEDYKYHCNHYYNIMTQVDETLTGVLGDK